MALLLAAGAWVGLASRAGTCEFAGAPRAERLAVAQPGRSAGWSISFAVRESCDATVAIQDAGGTIVRHLASGVLGTNAPLPFQRGSLLQRIEWDGLDDAGRPAPTGCTVRVGLGLQAKYALSIAWHSHDLAPVSDPAVWPTQAVVAASGGLTYVAVPTWLGWHGRVYDQQGNYVRTFWPPPAERLAEVADQLYGNGPARAYVIGKSVPRETVWGERVWSGPLHGPFESSPYRSVVNRGNITSVLARVAGGSVSLTEEIPVAIRARCPAAYPRRGALFERVAGTYHWTHLAVDRRTDELYVCGRDLNFQDQPVSLFRLDGRSGRLDESWFTNGEFRCVNAQVGPDGLLYARLGPRGQWIIRLDHAGKPVDFPAGATNLPHGRFDTGEVVMYGDGWSPALKGTAPRVLWVGRYNAAFVQERGLYISPRGIIAAAVEVDKPVAFDLQNGVPAAAATGSSFVRLWDTDGRLLTGNAVGNLNRGNGVAVDAAGNIYAAFADALPAAQVQGSACTLYGLARPYAAADFHSVGTLLRFDAGSAYPLSSTAATSPGASLPAGALALSNKRHVTGAAWGWGGLDNQACVPCACHHVRYDMDYFARHWIPANYLNAVVVLDANGNVITHLGRYGNVDDSEGDLRSGGDGLRFAWMKAAAASDHALYVADRANRRILRATLSYKAEGTIPLP